MIYSLYAVKDDLCDFLAPVCHPNDPVAMRAFQYAFSTFGTDSSIGAFRPTDFSLYRIGTYDTLKGLVESCVPPVLICRGTPACFGGVQDG